MTIVMAVILVPFFIFHEEMDLWTEQLLDASGDHVSYTVAILTALLASDVLLPIPSSLVSTGAGYLLGFANGAIVSWLGMTAGCVIGYALGSGSIKALRWLDDETKTKMEEFFQRAGLWAIVVCRPVPVLAEASVIFAGMSKMNFRKFLLVTGFSNLGISIVYAAVGAYSVSENSFLLAFAGAIILPGIAKVVE
ncbi:MAG: DedA family protein, partial [Bacteroidetes bacterium]